MAYPLILTDLSERRCVVVGGGGVAERKVAGLLEAGAHPEVISPTLTVALACWRAEGRITHHARRYRPGDLTGAFLVFAATGDGAVNCAAAAEGTRAGALVNVADDPQAGTFHTVAAVRRGDLLLSVSTGGASPALAAHIRRELESQYGPEYERLLTLLRAVRTGPARALPPHRRRRLWRSLPLDQLLEQLRLGDDAAAAALLQELLEGRAREGFALPQTNP
ncbi:MAG TPA: bifunctional precorrin-2 dehydrogenase/sirohydrochlorin ferrochelatase [Roseiflexaceae bacterium]|nr:bifunctional precorrin-2 dehydrogenase/sirohydrochlorin ferrochelatase [Roseiflexaceae bacterium]